MIKRIIYTITICIILNVTLRANEGMWLPLLLGQLNEAEMQEMGMKLSAEDIYSINQGSLKDAIVHFGGFCTSELISDQGLLLTNHHCGYGQIQQHSSVDNNLIKNGFWAENLGAELPNEGLSATFINYIKDVTGIVLDGISDDMAADERQSAIDKNINGVLESIPTEPFQKIKIKPFFKGNQYFLFFTTVYPDVRLVGAPPESIGKFGADTDNWVYPRHTGDFSLFRIYAGPDNAPAAYAEENIPYKPKHFLPISLDGVEEGDFTMIFGFPGRTNQYLPSGAVSQIIEDVNPNRIAVRDDALKILDAEMKADPKVKIKYASKFASIANYWKKWIGEKQGLEKSKAVNRKIKLEEEFNSRVNDNIKFKNKYGGLVNQMNDIYAEQADLAQASAMHNEIFGRNIELVRILNVLDDLKKRYKNNGEEAYTSRLERVKPWLKNIYKNYDPKIDKYVCEKLIKLYFNSMPDQYNEKEWAANFLKSTKSNGVAVLYRSFITDEDKVFEIIEDPEKLTESLLNDPAAKFFMPLQSRFNKNVSEPLNAQKTELNTLQRRYMAGLIEVFPEKRFFPDANSTMRVTYGQVKGYKPKDGVCYTPQTYLQGVMEKYIPGDYEFDVDERLIELYEDKDYGPYASPEGKMPVCFIGTNHTTGGNSGSPVIDAEGNLIGLNFDRVWEGTMSDINYDAEICRNIMVDARYILFIIDKYAGAKHLVEEMKLVRPKTKIE